MLERKNSDFRMFVASTVKYKFHDLMVSTMQKHGVNESYR